jgi:hypothetical protein
MEWKTSSPGPYSSITTLHHVRMDNLLLRSYPIQDTLPAHRRVFKPEWKLESLEAEKRALSTREAVELSYN